MSISIPQAFDRHALLMNAAAHTDIDEACRVIQRGIGQTDGGIAGIFFSDDEKVAGYQNASDPRERALILSEYLDLEASFSRGG